MADYSQLMSLEKKTKAAPPPLPSAPAGLPANQQTSKEANQPGSKPVPHQTSTSASEQTNKSVKKQTNKPTNQQTTKEKRKYTSYLRDDSISAIQILAIRTNRKDHEVLQDIVDTYFASRK
jgi:hypothetical protein